MIPKKKKVCCVCGDIGYCQLLIYCSECCDSSIHKYCLGIIPGSEDDTGIFNWVSESCCPSMESNPYAIVLVEDQPEPLQIWLPIKFPGMSQAEETSNRYQYVEETPGIAFRFITDCDEELHSSCFIKIPEAIPQGLVLIVNLLGEITIHESWNILSLTSTPYEISFDTLVKQLDPFFIKHDCACVGDGAQSDDENEQTYSVEDTVELDLGSDEDSDSKTMELNIGTDEENGVCYPAEHHTIHGFENHKDTSSEPSEGSTEAIMEDQVPRRIKASKNEVSGLTLQHRLSDNESEYSISPGRSILASVLDMANELLESTLEKIDVLVGPYKISSDLAPILRDVLSTYGDIFHDCAVEPDPFLVTVCKTIQHLESTPFESLRQKHVDFVREALKVPEAFGVDVKWLYKHCDYLQEIVQQTVKYLALKQEMNQIVRNVRSQEMAGLKEDHLKKLEGDMENIKFLWKRIYRKSLADGLF